MLLVAWVRFVRDGEEVSMSKRAGEFITLDELLAEVGVGRRPLVVRRRARPARPSTSTSSWPRKQSAENPVYYVQYAHARIRSILRKAADVGIRPRRFLGRRARRTTRWRRAWRGRCCACRRSWRTPRAQQTQGVTAYATDLATTFHAYYRDRRVVDPDDPVTSARRLALADAPRLALRNTLDLLGISAPDSM